MKLIKIFLTIFLIFFSVSLANSTTFSTEIPAAQIEAFEKEFEWVEKVNDDLKEFISKLHWKIDDRAHLEAQVEKIGNRFVKKWNITKDNYYIELSIYTDDQSKIYINLYIDSKIYLKEFYMLYIPVIEVTTSGS